MGAEPNEDHRRRELSFRLRTLERALLDIGPQVRWARSARFLWNLIRVSIGGVSAQLRSVDPADVEYEDTVSNIETVTDVLHALLGYVEEGQPERVPQAIVSALEDLVRPIAPKSRVLVCYDWTPSNYGYLEAFREELNAVVRTSVRHDAVDPKSQEAVNVVPDMFAIVFLPAAEQDSVLLHAALAHEIGHGICEVAAIDPPTVMPDGVVGELMEAEDGELLGVLSDFYVRSQAWKRELVADALSVCLLGPAPFMSLYRLAPNAEPSETHPDSNLRFQLMSVCLKKLCFLNEDNVPPDLSWLPDTVTRAVEGSQSAVENWPDQVFRLAHTHLEHNVERIAETAIAFGMEKSCAFGRDGWDADYAQDADAPRHQLVRRILHAVPPDTVERVTDKGMRQDQAARLPAILNAGWAVYADPKRWLQFCQIFEDGPVQHEFESRRKLQNLVLKAIDTVNVKREWGATA